MKKTVIAKFAIFIFLSVIVLHNVFSNPQGMVAAYVNVPAGWENPCIWAWDDAGNSAFSAWPGQEAEADPSNRGWYYIYLPNWAVNVIVNANDGSIQTEALKANGNDFWVTVRSPENAEVSLTALTTGQAPEYIEKINVYTKVPADWTDPCLWAWAHPAGTNAFASWPGGVMRNTSGSQWYNIRVPSWINSIIINGNKGSVQTSDLKVDTVNDIWVVVESAGKAEVYYENPDLMVSNITIFAQVPADWVNPCLWAWSHPDGVNAFASWPGEPFTKNGDWYEIRLPGWVNSVIVNANGGAVQTGDMKEIETGKNIWITVTGADNYTYSYSAPVAGSATSSKSASTNPVIWILIILIGAAAAAISIVVIKKKKNK